MNWTEKQAALKALREEQEAVCKEQNVPVLPLVCNDRLRGCSARIFFFRHGGPMGPNPTKIEISGPHIEAFGAERMIGALRHELAHQVAMIKYGITGHAEAFKRICADMDGSMNRRMAGARYSQCATDDFIKVENWRYTCPDCGNSWTRSRRYTTAQAARRVCKCSSRTSLLRFKVERLGK